MNDLASRIASLPPEKRALLEARLLRERGDAGPRLEPRFAPGDAAPLSFGQERLWFLDKLAPGSSLYNVPEALSLEGRLDPGALERALRAIVQRHQVLRTSFGGEDGSPRARVQDVAFRLAITDLSNLPEARREGEARAAAAPEAEAPFDLTKPPLLRAHLFRLRPETHWLVLTMPHIVCDDWSMGVLFHELSALYAAALENREAALPPLPVQYADFAAWHRERLERDRDGQLAWWKKTLAGDLPTFTFPFDRPRPAVQSFRGAEHRSRLAATLVARLERIGRDESATLFMTVLAAFETLLGRYSGEEEILVGVPVAGRNRVETEGLIGFFVNMLVLRGDLSGSPGFRELLRRVRAGVLESFARQDVPFERLVEELRPERNLSRSPIFQVSFELDSAAPAFPELPGLAVEPVWLPDATSKFDLRLLALREADGGMRLVFEYATDLFDAATIERLAANFETLLESIAADPDRSIARLPLLSSSERRLLAEVNRTDAEYPRQRSVHALFSEQAARSPEAIAVESDEGRLTYAALEEDSNRLARRLRSFGVAAGTLVGLCVGRSCEMVVALLGILKAGGAYVPLDATYPAERLRRMLEDSGARVLVTQESLRELVAGFDGRVVSLDGERDAVAAESSAPLESRETPDDLAYVMYTSGSTGAPKGVMVPHRALVNYLVWCLRAYDVASGTGAPVQSSLSFDLTITGLYAPLLCGKRVRLLPEGFSTEALVDVLRREGDFSLVKITPARLDLLSHDLPPESAAGGTRAFVIGGEALRAQSVALWRRHAPETALFNEYGPTETVVGCAIYRILPEDPESGPVPIGTPIANARLHVLDRHGEPVPIGVPGELYIGGDGVALGYWNHPDLTAERFVPDPFETGRRLYRSGDAARLRPDGNFEFLGRLDDQVKIRGYRVEPGEIETALRAHPAVSDAAAAAQEEGTNRRLAAYVVVKPGLPWSPETLRRHLLERLPEYMVPSVFVRLDALPLTKNGKVDRRALPSPDWHQRNLERDYVPPQDALELHLARIWESVLQTSPVGLDDDFFELGGHSLLAVRLFAEMEKATGKKLPLGTLFQAPTVRQIADLLRKKGGESPWQSLVPIQPRGARPPFYCVHAVGGSVLPYRVLARRLGPDQPFYGLQARSASPGEVAPRTIEQMASAYLAEIRHFQPEGPYFLGGHSAGGLVAFEMARRLRAEGQEVALVALFDTWAPGHGEIIPEKLLKMKWQAWTRRLSRFRDGIRASGGGLAYLREKLAVRWRVLRREPRSDLPQEVLRVKESIERALDDYRPGPYDGRVVLFRAAEQPPEYAVDRTLGWAALCAGGVEVHEVAGHHGELVYEPQAGILAERIRACLDRAIRGRGSETSPGI